MIFKNGLKFFLFCLLYLFFSTSFASSFQIWEQSGDATGDFVSGEAASAHDATTAWYNPAGMTQLGHQEISASAMGVYSRTRYTGYVRGDPPISGQNDYYGRQGSHDGGVFGTFMYTLPLFQRWDFGFSLTAPFGFGSDFGRDTFTRYAQTVETGDVIDGSPTLAFQITNNFSIGGGADILYMAYHVENYQTDTSQIDDTLSTDDYYGNGFGLNIGALWKPTSITRVGLTYRSQAVFHLSGESKLEGPLTFYQLYQSRTRLNITLPATTALAVYQQVIPKLVLQGTINYTEWSVLDRVLYQNCADINNLGEMITSNIQENFHYRNTWRFAAGANYQINHKWLIRTGAGYDQAPSKKQYRGIENSGDHFVISVGAEFQPTKRLSFDLGYGHLFSVRARTTGTQLYNSSAVYVDGYTDHSIDELGFEINWAFL